MYSLYELRHSDTCYAQICLIIGLLNNATLYNLLVKKHFVKVKTYLHNKKYNDEKKQYDNFL